MEASVNGNGDIRVQSEAQGPLVGDEENPSQNLNHRSGKFSLIKCLNTTLGSRYFYASAVYVAYSCAMLANDYVGDTKYRNQLYFQFAIVHLIDAFLYFWAWDDKGYLDPYVYPEYLNILGAALYLWSACLYPSEFTSDDDYGTPTPSFYTCRHIELSAAVVEVFASIGWIVTWWWGVREKYGQTLPPGIGLSLEDPDFHACWTIMLAALLYLIYNVQVLDSPDRYYSDFVYVYGDYFYLFNSIFYFLAALRDYGWFVYLPLPSTYFGINGSSVGGNGQTSRGGGGSLNSGSQSFDNGGSNSHSSVMNSSSDSYTAFGENSSMDARSVTNAINASSSEQNMSGHEKNLINNGNERGNGGNGGRDGGNGGRDGGNGGRDGGNGGRDGGGVGDKLKIKSKPKKSYDSDLITTSLLHEPLTPPTPTAML